MVWYCVLMLVASIAMAIAMTRECGGDTAYQRISLCELSVYGYMDRALVRGRDPAVGSDTPLASLYVGVVASFRCQHDNDVNRMKIRF